MKGKRGKREERAIASGLKGGRYPFCSVNMWTRENGRREGGKEKESKAACSRVELYPNLGMVADRLSIRLLRT